MGGHLTFIILGNVLGAVITVISGAVIYKNYKFRKEFNKLKQLRNKRIKEKEEIIAQFQEYVNGHYLEKSEIRSIITKNLNELRKFNKEAGNRKAIAAYQKKAIAVNKATNCVNEFINIDLDEVRVGPLAGIPFSIKDNYQIKGYYSYVGCSKLLEEKSDCESLLVTVLRSLGAVPFVKTNTPQTMMSYYSSNPIDGLVRHPWNDSKSPGGSSSGEASLIGAGGSLFGLGTDIGGSVRLPAALCGIIGFKPTVKRLSKKNMLSISKISLVEGACGILGRDVITVTEVFKHIVNCPLHSKLDPNIPPIVFRDDLFSSKSTDSNKKIKIGILQYDGSFKPIPACDRVTRKASHILKHMGYEVVEWKPPRSGRYWLKLFLSGLSVDKARDIRKLCMFDEKDPSVQHFLTLFDLSYCRLKYLKLLTWIKGDVDSSVWLDIVDKFGHGSEILSLQREIEQFREAVIESWLQEDLDAVICPAGGFASLPAIGGKSMTGMMSYLNLWNLVDFPAGTVPISKIQYDDEWELEVSYPKNASLWHLNNYNSQQNSLNLPLSVQVVSRPWQEETCLRIMKELSDYTASQASQLTR